MLLGLRVNGRAVVGPSDSSASAWTTFLGRQPPENHIKGRHIRISWLKQILEETEISENSSHEELIIYTRMYNILCIALTLFPDKSAKDIHSMWIPFVRDLRQCREYSWGSTVLEFLYREICKVVKVDVDDGLRPTRKKIALKIALKNALLAFSILPSNNLLLMLYK
ncbi:protein MAIN-LIKE 2-like [Lathyrus oleraceus]|uniref:protein MAIN-LIKE 2-like n=1 Tax=Pisum sativum TaxID=3888 RepID=UPI0021D387E6|nr:protein MAIN-LIKE 2-like [Pisum sativum]